MGPLDVGSFLRVFASAFVIVLFQAVSFVILVRVLLSWVPVRLPLGLGELVFGVSETILRPIRRALPPMGGMDLSPFVALLAIQFVAQPLAEALLRALPYP